MLKGAVTTPGYSRMGRRAQFTTAVHQTTR